MTSTTGAPSGVKVPVWRGTKDAWRAVVGNMRSFAHLAWFPALIYAATAIAFSYIADSSNLETIRSKASPSAFFVLAITLLDALLLAFINIFVVRWHRFMLLNERIGAWNELFNRQWQLCFLYGLIIALPSQANELISWLIGDDVKPLWLGLLWGLGQFAIAIGIIAFAIFAFGSSLIFPAAAMGHPIKWRAAWRLLDGNFWRLACCFILVGSPITLAFIYVNAGRIHAAIQRTLPDHRPDQTPLLVSASLNAILMFVSAGLFASVLCGFYRRIVFNEVRSA